MIRALIAWPFVSAAIALLIGDATRICRSINRIPPQPEPDFLWDQPTDVLSDAAVDARFAEIVAHFRVLS